MYVLCKHEPYIELNMHLHSLKLRLLVNLTYCSKCTCFDIRQQWDRPLLVFTIRNTLIIPWWNNLKLLWGKSKNRLIGIKSMCVCVCVHKGTKENEMQPLLSKKGLLNLQQMWDAHLQVPHTQSYLLLHWMHWLVCNKLRINNTCISVR